MAPGGEGEGKGGRKVRSPKAQAEEETRRRPGQRGLGGGAGWGRGGSGSCLVREKGNAGKGGSGRWKLCAAGGEGPSSGWGGAGQTRRAGPPSLPQRRGVQGILPASLRPAAGPARRVTKSSGGWHGQAAREGGEWGRLGSGRDGEAEAPGAASSSRGFLPSRAELQNGGCAGPRERSETPPRARAMAAAAARGRARLRGRAEAGGGAGPGVRAPVPLPGVRGSGRAAPSPFLRASHSGRPRRTPALFPDNGVKARRGPGGRDDGVAAAEEEGSPGKDSAGPGGSAWHTGWQREMKQRLKEKKIQFK
ncbi:spidroin-2-like [Zonotrichia leucophrys gambelii]|uniref:spidroin-2-like n=1 Tax=Zonotrichia leucophrys gambelii TaxID=257770 RepID=UPI0031409036